MLEGDLRIVCLSKRNIVQAQVASQEETSVNRIKLGITCDHLQRELPKGAGERLILSPHSLDRTPVALLHPWRSPRALAPLPAPLAVVPPQNPAAYARARPAMRHSCPAGGEARCCWVAQPRPRLQA